MAPVSTEVEIHNSSPPEKLFKIIGNFDTLAPKAAPELYKSITTVEGDGGVGTIKTVLLADGTTSKQRIDAVDLNNFSFSFTVIEGEALLDYIESISHHIKISPAADGGSVYKHTTVFNCKGETKPTEEILNKTNEGYKKSFNAIDAYAKANADAF